MLASVEALYFLTTDVSSGFKGRSFVYTFAAIKVLERINISLEKF
jgi:hypothetical protein